MRMIISAILRTGPCLHQTPCYTSVTVARDQTNFCNRSELNHVKVAPNTIDALFTRHHRISTIYDSHSLLLHAFNWWFFPDWFSLKGSGLAWWWEKDLVRNSKRPNVTHAHTEILMSNWLLINPIEISKTTGRNSWWSSVNYRSLSHIDR